MTFRDETSRSPCKIALLKGVILACIIEAGRIHGYEVYKNIVKLTKGKWSPSIGTIYKVLNELAEQGLLERIEERKGQKTIAYYQITRKGIQEYLNLVKKCLERWLIGLTLMLKTLKIIKSTRGYLDPTIEAMLRKLSEELSKLSQ